MHESILDRFRTEKDSDLISTQVRWTSLVAIGLFWDRVSIDGQSIKIDMYKRWIDYRLYPIGSTDLVLIDPGS